MNDAERRHFERAQGIDKFGIDNAADFSGITVATDNFTLIHDIVAAIESVGGELMASRGEYSSEVSQKSLAREALRAWMSQVAKTARGMVYAFPGIDEIFHMPRNRNDADLLTAARAFVTEGQPRENDFQAYGMPDKWPDEGHILGNAFETAMGETVGAKAEKVGKAALLEDWVLQSSRAFRILDPVVRNVYIDNVEMTAAWDSSSHLEKAPKKKTPPPTP
jgi:hypothetical protein